MTSGTPMKRSTSSGSKSQKSSSKVRKAPKRFRWSESIIVLGEGIDHWSRNYRRLTHCIAGIGESGGWIRLYPIIPFNIQTFNIIRVAIRDKHPERIRPESRKVHADAPLKIIEHIKDEKKKIKILKTHLDSGKFLHDDSWKRIKTLGLIQPIYPEFEVNREKRQVTVRYKCDAPECSGHRCAVLDAYKIDRVGRRWLRMSPNKIETKLVTLNREHLLGRNQLWFVMGTLLNHPQKWIVVEVHVTETEHGTERLRRWIKTR